MGLIQGVLPWLGIATGVAYVVAGIGFATFFMVGWNALLVGQVLYIVWAIWLGVKLSRSKAPTHPMAVASAAH